MIKKSKVKLGQQSGFTFVEVMVAIVIFVVAVLAAVDLARGSVSATREAREISIATWLLQDKITELETRLELEGFDRACDQKKEGKFEAPYEQYTWVSYCNEIDFKIAEAATALSGDDKEEASTPEATQVDQFKKIIINTASDYIGKAIRELHVEVLWKQGKNPRKVNVTTHVARYDLPFQMNSAGVGQ